MSKYGSFNIKGLDELEKAIKEKYEGAKGKRIIRQAVNSGGEVVAKGLIKNYGTVVDKGYSQGYTKEDVTRSNAKISNDTVTAKVGWNGSHERWRLVHLEEWGYTRHGRQYKPPQVGVIERTLKEIETPYFAAVQKGMMEFL